MHRTRTFIIIIGLTWVTGACLRQPEHSIIPQIQLQSVVFKHEFPSKPDTLIVKLKFTDGDGDLGINGDETAIYTSPTSSMDISTPIYQVYETANNAIWYPVYQNNGPLKEGYQYVNYASYRTIHALPFDTLPGALTCKNWELRASPADTLYIQQNPYANNIFVYVYTKNQDGSYTYFDPTDPKIFPFGDRCVTNFFNGRFMVLSSDLGKISPLEGTITYKIQSVALYSYLHGKTVKIKAYILDRAFHKSNVVESGDFLIR